MLHYKPKAMHETTETTLGAMLEEGWLDRVSHATDQRRQCTDEQPLPSSSGDYATCLRCELLACQDPRQDLRRKSPVEIHIDVQVQLKSYMDLVRWTG